jgi:hypothetical protein
MRPRIPQDGAIDESTAGAGDERIWSESDLVAMPNREQIVELELKIENLRTAIEGLRVGNATRAEMDRVLSELARVKAERLRLMLRQVNFSTEQRLYQTTATRGPKDREASAARLSNPDE